jgi:hypothetical protein
MGRIGVNGALEWWSTGVVEYWGQPSAFFFKSLSFSLFRQLRGKRVGESGVMAFSRH